MSDTYAVHCVCKRVATDEGFRAALREDPESVLAGLDLKESQRDALLRGDVAELYEAGAHEYVLMWLGRFEVLGLDLKTFMQRIQTARSRYES